MKVAIVSNTPPFLTGAGTAMTAIAIEKYLRSHNLEAHVLAISSENKKVLVNGTKTLCFRKNVLPDFSLPLLKYILRKPYDRYIFIGSSHISLSIAMLLLRWKSRSKKIVLIPQWHQSFLFRNILTALLFHLKRIFFDYPIFKLIQPTTVCYTKREALSLKNFVKDVYVIPLGLNLNRHLWSVYDNVIRDEYHRYARLLYVGQVEINKFPLFVIEALRIFNNEFYGKFVFHVVGPIESVYLNKLRTMLKDANLDSHIVFTGTVNENELARYYKNADVFVFPSFSESFGYSLIEAVYASLPVVATRTGISPYLEKLGLIMAVNFGDARTMATKIYESYQASTRIRQRLLKERQFLKSEFDAANFLSGLYCIIMDQKVP